MSRIIFSIRYNYAVTEARLFHPSSATAPHCVRGPQRRRRLSLGNVDRSDVKLQQRTLDCPDEGLRRHVRRQHRLQSIDYTVA